MCRDSGQLSSNGSIDIFHDIEIGREEDIEVALMHQGRCDRDSFPLPPCLYNRRVDSLHRIWKRMKVARDQSVSWEELSQDLKEVHQPGWYILRLAEIVGKWQPVFQRAKQAR